MMHAAIHLAAMRQEAKMHAAKRTSNCFPSVVKFKYGHRLKMQPAGSYIQSVSKVSMVIRCEVARDVRVHVCRRHGANVRKT